MKFNVCLISLIIVCFALFYSADARKRNARRAPGSHEKGGKIKPSTAPARRSSEGKPKNTDINHVIIL